MPSDLGALTAPALADVVAALLGAAGMASAARRSRALQGRNGHEHGAARPGASLSSRASVPTASPGTRARRPRPRTSSRRRRCRSTSTPRRICVGSRQCCDDEREPVPLTRLVRRLDGLQTHRTARATGTARPGADPLRLARASAADLAAQAAQLRDAGFGSLITYSRKVFLPLTQLCRDSCHYCTFAKAPRHLQESVHVGRGGRGGRSRRARSSAARRLCSRSASVPSCVTARRASGSPSRASRARCIIWRTSRPRCATARACCRTSTPAA